MQKLVDDPSHGAPNFLTVRLVHGGGALPEALQLGVHQFGGHLPQRRHGGYHVPNALGGRVCLQFLGDDGQRLGLLFVGVALLGLM